jgi:hypothetical protein
VTDDIRDRWNAGLRQERDAARQGLVARLRLRIMEAHRDGSLVVLEPSTAEDIATLLDADRHAA